MDKYEYIVNLAEKTAKRVSQNRESWMKFLTSAARIYKYPFKEQLLIYAQNPDATACQAKISSICRLDQVCMTQERMQETLS